MNKIRKTLDKVSLKEEEKKLLYKKIRYHENKNIILNYKFIAATLTFVMVFMVGNLNHINYKNNNIRISPMSETKRIIYNDECYNQIFIEYEIGDNLEKIMIDSIKYKVYKNKMNEESIILHNDNYEVYIKCEE